MPPLLPIWLPLIGAAIVSGFVLAWRFPPAPPGTIPPPVRFTDVTDTAGLSFVHRIGADPAESPTTLGGGVVCFDYDGDGDVDIFLVNGADWPWEESFAKRAQRGGCALFRNDGTGRFTDVSALAEVNLEFQGMAGAAGDFDDDGRPDLFVTGIGANHLFHNRGHGRFEDITDRAGLGGEENTWSTGAVWLDCDGDGRLDLVVVHYARWPREVGLAGAFSVALMGHSYGAPTGFVAAPPTVYRNEGGGRFAAVPDSAGLRPIDPATGLPAAKALAVTPVDANADGRLDLLMAFHTVPDVLFLNEGNGTFRAAAGPVGKRSEGESAGVAAAGSLGLLPTREGDTRYATWQALIASIPRSDERPGIPLGAHLGAVLCDFDVDGRLDAFSGAGRAEADVNRFENARDFRATPRLWWNRGDRLFPIPLDDFAPIPVRAIAGADFDGDGDVDLVLTQFQGSPQLLRNDQRRDVPWLGVDLVATRTPREAGGARIELHTPRGIQIRLVAPAMGLFAQSEATQYFGLGDDARVRKIVVRWPSGVRQEERVVEINRRLSVVER